MLWEGGWEWARLTKSKYISTEVTCPPPPPPPPPLGRQASRVLESQLQPRPAVQAWAESLGTVSAVSVSAGGPGREYYTILYHMIPYTRLCYTILHYITFLPYHILLYSIILYYTTLPFIRPYCIILYDNTLYYTTLYCTALNCTVLCCVVLYIFYMSVRGRL